MNLKQLKLSGFKSFVDPTVVHFPTQLVAVVGPNGCGKSNIIDAVRWVMGESSARNLRGELMSDVIFNGSSNRKSVGQACVELVFDNNLGRLAGPFASYGEIAVKRIVTRDGDSSYYLNGSRCRRKDITDIFLGTGAGARGYSIIGQGTISQLIEAKPEDLRVFLEEAAGVSKYKERRRETLQCIADTRENLTQVMHIRDELEKQLQRLERQATAAKRYLILKEEEQLCRAEILALKWQSFILGHEVKKEQLDALMAGQQEQQSILIKANKERVILNESLHDAQELTQKTQERFYQLSTEMVRLEEMLHQQTREKKRLEQEMQHMQEDWHGAQAQLKQDNEELLSRQQNIHQLEERLEQYKEQFKDQEAQWIEAQKQHTQWTLHWEEVHTQSNTLKRELQVAELNAQHRAQSHHQTLLRLEKLQLEKESLVLSTVDLHDIKKDLEGQRVALVEAQQQDAFQLKESLEKTVVLRTQLQEIERQLHALQDDFHGSNSEHAALIAAQHAARQSRKNNKNGIGPWSDKPRLMDILQVDSKWQVACEQVFNDALHAYVLETFDEFLPHRTPCEQHGEYVVTRRQATIKTKGRSRLVDKIYGVVPATAYPLEHIYTAQHFDEALSWLPELKIYESIVTPEGFWLGQGWVKFINPEKQEGLGLLARQQKIAELSLSVDELQLKITELRAKRDHTHQLVQKSLKNNELFQLNANASNEVLRTNSSLLSTNEQTIIHSEKRMASLAFECEELQLSLEEAAAGQSKIKDIVHLLAQEYQASEQQNQHCLHKKHEWLECIALKKKQVDENRVILQQAELEYDREKNKIQQLGERAHREQERLDGLRDRLENLAHLCVQAENPAAILKEQLTQQVQNHNEVEVQLTLSREQLAQLRKDLDVCEKKISSSDSDIKHMQERISEARIEAQALMVRASSVQEALDEWGLQAATVLEKIPVAITQNMREDELIVLYEKIKRLGAINLAAIDECAAQQQRKTYLDEQYNDLHHALNTLETAIEKMDKETHARLEHTFNEVNRSFKALFPRLFGGGKAQLELTCDNLLEAGIVVMAQPPGKRNSTIYLLSGGEKAMTAVALVFAIFQLNPSPFCMLDEVDAPLDDVNVGRFCTLVKEMSQFVQFLFITHNKVTMELADHLIGVTMREPGVSRLVAVDVTHALAME